MHRHCDSHGVSRGLTEGCCAAANEKSARQPGREPETFHDSDELTNFGAAAQRPSVKLRLTRCESQCRCIQMAHAPFTTSITHSTQPCPRQQIRMAKFVRRFVINSTTLAGSRPEKFPDRMVAFGSRAVTSTTTRAASWKKLKAQPTARFCTRSFTATIQWASKLVILSLMPPAN